MSVSLPPDKLADIQLFPLLHTQPITVCQIMSFLGKANFCANWHFQLQRFCHVIQSDMLTVYPTPLFSSVHFSLSALHQLKHLSCLHQCPVPLQFPLPGVVIATVPWSLIWPFIFKVLVYPYQLVDPGLVLCVGLILPCRSFRQLP